MRRHGVPPAKRCRSEGGIKTGMEAPSATLTPDTAGLAQQATS
jgi:hypothetical protein